MPFERDFQKGRDDLFYGLGVDHILKLRNKTKENWKETDFVEQDNWQTELNLVYWQVGLLVKVRMMSMRTTCYYVLEDFSKYNRNSFYYIYCPSF